MPKLVEPTKKLRENLNESAAKDLLREYSEKLASLCQRGQEVVGHIRHGGIGLQVPKGTNESGNEILEFWKALRPPMVALAQYASGTIEHARIDQITELELRLRLVELEHFLHRMDSVAEMLRDFVKR